jgi:hypothetical protein
MSPTILFHLHTIAPLVFALFMQIAGCDHGGMG